MSSKKPFVRQMHERCARLKPQIALGFDKDRLVVVAVLRHGHTHWCGLRPPTRATCALLVVLDAWRDVAADHSLQLTDVHAKFHRSRATQQANFAFLKVAFELFTNTVVDGCGMLLHHHAGVALTQVETEVMALPLLAVPLDFAEGFQFTVASEGGAFA